MYTNRHTQKRQQVWGKKTPSVFLETLQRSTAHYRSVHMQGLAVTFVALSLQPAATLSPEPSQTARVDAVCPTGTNTDAIFQDRGSVWFRDWLVSETLRLIFVQRPHQSLNTEYLSSFFYPAATNQTTTPAPEPPIPSTCNMQRNILEG